MDLERTPVQLYEAIMAKTKTLATMKDDLKDAPSYQLAVSIQKVEREIDAMRAELRASLGTV